MSYNTILFALVAGVLSFILIFSIDSINPILITNILLGAIVGILIDKKKPQVSYAKEIFGYCFLLDQAPKLCCHGFLRIFMYSAPLNQKKSYITFTEKD